MESGHGRHSGTDVYQLMMRTFAQFLVLSLVLATPSVFAQTADLTVDPTVAAPTQVPLGQRVTVRFTIVNHGPSMAKSVVIHLDGDPQWHALQITFPGNCVSDCAIGDLIAGGGSYGVSVTAIAPVQPASLHITLTATSSTTDPDLSNNSAAATIEAFDAPDLRVALSVFNVFRPESRGSLDAVVFNTGSMTANGVALIIDLPPGSKALSGSGPAGFECEPDGTRIVCRGDTLPVTGFSPVRFHIVFVNPPLNDGGTVTATAQIASIERDFNDSDNTARASWAMPQFFAVTSLEDSGPGSLRDTINVANAACRPQCVVGIRIPGPLPPSGFFTIRPQSPLPSMTFPGTLDARAETDLLGIDFTTPLVMLDGSSQSSGDGVTIIPTSTSGVAGFAIGNFPRFGVFITDGVYPTTVLTDDYLGVDATGNAAAPNLRGVVNAASTGSLALFDCVVSGNVRSGIQSSSLLSVSDCRIGVAAQTDAPLPNGGSGIYVPTATPTFIESSVIAWNREFAIALNPQQHEVDVSKSSIDHNGGSIDYGMDGLTPNAADDSSRPPNYPILDDAHYDAATGKTVITLHLTSKPPSRLIPNPDESFYSIDADVYANDHPDAQAQHYRGLAQKGTLTVDGDLRGQFITAVTKRHRLDCHYDACTSREETSEISPAIPVR